MKRPIAVVLVLAAVLALAGCSAARSADVPVAEGPSYAGEEAPAAAEPASAPIEAPAAEADQPPAQDAAGGLAMADLPSPYQEGRKIIKVGDMALRVADTDAAIDRVTLIAVGAGGYIVSSETEERDGAKYASLRLGVPVDTFEETQRDLRAIAIRVLRDTASGEDVTDQFVDQQSRLTNLEATAARIREFLADAKTVEEALKVNQQLTEIEGEIEQTKGRLNYLKDRAAFSTITVSLEPELPTPTPTPTATPVVWKPGDTAEGAFHTLGSVSRGLGSALIWFTIVILPFVLPLVLIGWWLSRRRKARRAAAPPAPPTQTASPPAPPAAA